MSLVSVLFVLVFKLSEDVLYYGFMHTSRYILNGRTDHVWTGSEINAESFEILGTTAEVVRFWWENYLLSCDE